MHHAQRSNTAPMTQRLKFDTLGVADESDCTYLNTVQALEVRVAPAHPDGAAVLDLGADEALIDCCQCFCIKNSAGSAEEGKAAIGFVIHVGDVLTPGQVATQGKANNLDFGILRDLEPHL